MSKRSIKYVHSNYLLLQADKNPAVKGRASLTHELLRSYGLLSHMQILPAKNCNIANLRGFHSHDYVENLEKCSKALSDDDEDAFDKGNETCFNHSIAEEYGLGFDCPTWPGIVDYVCAISGATMTACDVLCQYAGTTRAPIVLNWTGGWHHAQREKAAGFCYVNDIVLGILVLRKRFQRVLYIDLDVHHGDGVEQAFEVTRRVFTLSFHKFECGYYPGSGAVEDCGRFAKGYCANFPFRNGITGDNFKKYFKRILNSVTSRYQPDACVLQCGADVIVGDPLGGTQLVPEDICDCVSMVLDLKIPTLMLGGGGYNFPNASRLWVQITASICGQKLSEDVPENNAYFLQYGPDYRLNINKPVFLRDENTDEYLESCAKNIEENLIKYNVTAV